MDSYHDRLERTIAARGRLCVGIDPHDAILGEYGYDISPAGLEAFCRYVIEQLGDVIAVFKPQSAFFERFGWQGIAVLSRVLSDIKQAGALSILDVKRGDIGSTLSAYAQAYLDPASDLAADAITVSPFLGVEALAPAFELAHQTGRGAYVLCRTSNPTSGSVQLASKDHVSVAQRVVDHVTSVNVELESNCVGLVIGATLTVLDVNVDAFSGSILAPGIGAQGAKIGDLPTLFARSSSQVLPTVSRGVLGLDPEHTMVDRAKGYLYESKAALEI